MFGCIVLLRLIYQYMMDAVAVAVIGVLQPTVGGTARVIVHRHPQRAGVMGGAKSPWIDGLQEGPGSNGPKLSPSIERVIGE